jgi:hypothetical protein
VDITVWPETIVIYVGGVKAAYCRREKKRRYMTERIWCDDTVCGQEWVLQVKALKEHYAKYAGTKSRKVHQGSKGPILDDGMKKI